MAAPPDEGRNPPPPGLPLEHLLSAIARLAPEAQRELDRARVHFGTDPSDGDASPVPCLTRQSVSIELALETERRAEAKLGVGILALPISAFIAVQHSEILRSAARLEVEVERISLPFHRQT